MLSTRNIAAGLTVVAALFTFGALAPSVLAGKPTGSGGGGGGGGGASAGTIYYAHQGAKQLYTMDLTGANDVKLGKYAYGAVSRLQHGGLWYYLDVRVDPATVDTTQDPVVTILRGDFDLDTNDTSATRILLHTSDLTFPMPDPNWGLRWGPGDDRVYFIAEHWNSTTVDVGGIYSAAFEVDSDGNITGFDESSVTLEFEMPIVTPTSGGNPYPDVRTFDLSVTGDLVYVNDSGLSVLDAGGSTPREIVTGRVDIPDFSPNGAQIAFTDPNIGVSVIGVDGTGRKQIVRPTAQWYFHSPHWSPDAKHIVLTGTERGLATLNTDLYVVNANGTKLTRLTATYATGSFYGISEVALAVR